MDVELIELGVQSVMRPDEEAAAALVEKFAGENPDVAPVTVAERHAFIDAPLKMAVSEDEDQDRCPPDN